MSAAGVMEFSKDGSKRETMKNRDDEYVINKKNCYGCMTCCNICPHEAIYTIEDSEGFLFPKIDQDRCTHCGLCRKHCPALQEYHCIGQEEQAGYVAQNSDFDTRAASTSGGVFSALASWCIFHDGIVFGAMLDDSLQVRHGFSDRLEACASFRGSKYVQSNIGKSYASAKHFLEQDKYVLFSGTPCQIEGPYSFLGKPYDRLITVDVVCKGVLSPGLFRNYLNFQKQSAKSPITNIKFREKRWGYKYTAMAIYSGKDCIYANGTESDAFLRAFFENDYNRLTCYQCQYRKLHRKSDITIWDCFNDDLYNKEMDDDTGVNKVLTHTIKGKRLIEELGNSKALWLHRVPVQKLISENSEALYENLKLNEEKRQKFYHDYKSLSNEDFWRKKYPDDLRIKTKRAMRKLLLFLGIYQKVRRLKNKYLKCI